MHRLKVVHRHLSGKRLGALLVADLCEHLPYNKSIIVTDKPQILLPALRKQWLRKLRRMRVERARLLSGPEADRLSEHIAVLEKVKFTTRKPRDLLEADVTLGTADDFVQIGPICRLAYVTYDFPKEKLHMLTSWMPPGGVVVIYEQS